MLKKGLCSLHGKQAAATRACVIAALKGGLLSSSRLARQVPGEAALMHRVKRMDRWPGKQRSGEVGSKK
jgi:hypothetical protein